MFGKSSPSGGCLHVQVIESTLAQRHDSMLNQPFARWVYVTCQNCFYHITSLLFNGLHRVIKSV